MNKVKLGEICKISAGGTPSRANPEFWENGSIPWVKISDMRENCIDKTEEFISDLGLKNSSAKVFKKGTILYTIFATLGKVGILNLEAATNQAIAGLEIIDEKLVNKKYLLYFLKSLETKVQEMGRGVAQNNLNLGIIKNLEIPLVSSAQQIMIVNLLERLDYFLTLKNKVVNYLNQLVKSQFIEMFGDLFNGKSKYPLIKISEVVSSKIERASKKFNDNEIIKYVDISSIDNNKNVIVGYTKYLKKNAPSRAQQRVVKDDIIISTVRPNLNNVAKISHDFDNIVASSGFCVLRAVKVEVDFLFTFISMQTFADYLSSLTTGANYPAVNIKDILNFEIPNAPLGKQREYSSLVKLVDKLKFNIEQQIEETQTLFDSYMQKYFG